MTVDVGRALSETVQEMATRRGLALVGGFVLVSALSLTLSWALAIALAESFLSALLGVGQEAGPALSGAEREMLAQQVGAVQEAAPIALDLPAGVALAALLAVALGADESRRVRLVVGHRPLGGLALLVQPTGDILQLLCLFPVHRHYHIREDAEH